MTIKQALSILVLLMMTTMASAANEQQLPAPIEALQARGIQVVGTFETPGGLTGYAAIMGQRPLAIYLTEDGERAIIGSMINSEGDFIHRGTLQEMVAEPMSKRIWSQLENSTWVAEGSEDAARTVYVFSDPNCPYCHVFWEQAQPWVQAGKVELRHVMVGIIGKTSPNKAAAIITANNPEQALVKNKKSFKQGGITPMQDIPAQAHSKLKANLRLMGQLGLRGTPGVIYRDDQGTVQIWRGVPPEQAMSKVMGPAPE